MISDEVAERQRTGKWSEVACSVCGCRTRDVTGMCGRCRRVGVFRVDQYTTNQLVGIGRKIRGELERRAAEAAAAVEMVTQPEVTEG